MKYLFHKNTYIKYLYELLQKILVLSFEVLFLYTVTWQKLILKIKINIKVSIKNW